MKQEIIKEAKPHKDTIEQRLKNLEYELHNELNESDILENKYPLITEIHRQLNLDNLTVAEDYLNRWNETGEQIEMIDSNEFRNEAFEGLLQEYEYIYSSCSKGKGESLMRIRARLKNTKGSMTGKATDIIKTWQGLNDDSEIVVGHSLVKLLKYLSFNDATLDKSEKISPNQWNFHIRFSTEDKLKPPYNHPFAVFGTKLVENGLNVMYLAGSCTVDGIVEKLITFLNSTVRELCGTVCIVDDALSLAERRKMAQEFKIREELQDIIVIDRVLVLYLMRFESDIMGVKLLKSTLPFARIQPYEVDEALTPEMFVGRDKEIATILNATGAVLVYGERQVGKTELLHQVCRLEDNPDIGKRAMMIELGSCDKREAASKLVVGLQQIGLIDKIKKIENWNEVGDMIRQLLEKHTVDKLMLLLDDAEELFTDFEPSLSLMNERIYGDEGIYNGVDDAIAVIMRLVQTFGDRFKVVLATGQKVEGFAQSVLVEQMRRIDMTQLLMIPMSYMGITVKNDVMHSMLAKASDIPRLVRHYGKAVVAAVINGHINGSCSAVKDPPYTFDGKFPTPPIPSISL